MEVLVVADGRALALARRLVQAVRPQRADDAVAQVDVLAQRAPVRVRVQYTRGERNGKGRRGPAGQGALGSSKQHAHAHSNYRYEYGRLPQPVAAGARVCTLVLGLWVVGAAVCGRRAWPGKPGIRSSSSSSRPHTLELHPSAWRLPSLCVHQRVTDTPKAARVPDCTHLYTPLGPCAWAGATSAAAATTAANRRTEKRILPAKDGGRQRP